MQSKPPSDAYCPDYAGQRDWLGRRLSMAQTCPTCPLWVLLRGKNPQDNSDVDSWGCAKAHSVLLQVELARGLRGVQAAVESRGNEQIKLMAENIMRQERQHREAISYAGNSHESVTFAPRRIEGNGNGNGHEQLHGQMSLPIESPPYADAEDMA